MPSDADIAEHPSPEDLDRRLPLLVMGADAVAAIPSETRREAALMDMSSTGTAVERDWMIVRSSAPPWSRPSGHGLLSAQDAGAAAPVTVTSSGRHSGGCACCQSRPDVVMTLLGLFQARARGQCGFFRQLVLIAPQGRSGEIASALQQDAAASALFAIRCLR